MGACRQRRKGATTTRLTRSTQLPELAVMLRSCDDSMSKCIMQAALNGVSAIRRYTKSHARHTTTVLSAEDTRPLTRYANREFNGCLARRLIEGLNAR